MLRLSKDPLVHFLVLGALLFVVSAWRGGEEESAERIVLGALAVERVADAAGRILGRPPDRAELRELLEPMIQDEVLYREALALGLDVDDDEVRRRLIEKMQYLTQDLAAPEPSDDQLRDYFAAHSERFALPAAVTFEHVFFSPTMRGDTLAEDVAAAQAALDEGVDPLELGDRTPLQRRFDAAARERVEVLFGESMTEALFSAAPGNWEGPYRSDFGLHLVRVLDQRPVTPRSFDAARDDVFALYSSEQRIARNTAEYERMRARYDIVIEWPASVADRDTAEQQEAVSSDRDEGAR